MDYVKLMFVYSRQCLTWIVIIILDEWMNDECNPFSRRPWSFLEFQITMILIWSPLDVSGEGSTMSIVSRSYFLAQLILILCDRVEKKCEVMQDDENLTRTKEKCQFPFKFRVWHNFIDNLFIPKSNRGKRIWPMHLHWGQKMSEVTDIVSKIQSNCYVLRWCPTKLDGSMDCAKMQLATNFIC